jgi:hypothetical protein
MYIRHSSRIFLRLRNERQLACMRELFKRTARFGDEEVCRKVLKGTFEKFSVKL